MTPELEGWKDIAKEAVTAAAGAVVLALVRMFRRRERPRPLSIAPEPERFTCTREEWDELMSKVAAMSTQIALHEQELERVKEDRENFKDTFASFTTTLGKLGEGIQAIQVQLARMGAPPA